MPPCRRRVDRCAFKRSDRREPNSLALVAGATLACSKGFFRIARVGEFGFFFGEKTAQSLEPRLISFLGEQPLIVLDIEPRHASIHARLHIWFSPLLGLYALFRLLQLFREFLPRGKAKLIIK